MGFALSGLGILVMYFLMCVYVTAFDVASEGTCYLSQIPASLFRRLSARNYCLLHTAQVHCFTDAGDCLSIHRDIHSTCTLKTDTFFYPSQR
jgi:hypothetical protein